MKGGSVNTIQTMWYRISPKTNTNVIPENKTAFRQGDIKTLHWDGD